MQSHVFRNKTFYYNQRPEFWAGVRDENGWEPETFDALDEFIKPRSLFFDIGAWNGICSLYASSLGARCIAVEPDKSAYQELLENVELNNANVKTINKAIANHTGTSMLHNMKDGFGNSMSSIYKREMDKDFYEVETITFDNLLIYGKPDFIKMDIEGAELHVIPQILVELKSINCPMWLSTHKFWWENGEHSLKWLYEQLFTIYDKTKTRYFKDQILLIP